MNNSFTNLDNSDVLRNLGLWSSRDQISVSREENQQPVIQQDSDFYTSETLSSSINDSLPNESSVSLLKKRSELENRKTTLAKKPKIHQESEDQTRKKELRKERNRLAAQHLRDRKNQKLDCLYQGLNVLTQTCQSIFDKKTTEKLSLKQSSKIRSKLICHSIHCISDTIITLAKKSFGENFVNENKLDMFVFSPLKTNQSILSNLLNGYNYLMEQAHILSGRIQAVPVKKFDCLPNEVDSIHAANFIQNILKDFIQKNLISDSFLPIDFPSIEGVNQLNTERTEKTSKQPIQVPVVHKQSFEEMRRKHAQNFRKRQVENLENLMQGMNLLVQTCNHLFPENQVNTLMNKKTAAEKAKKIQELVKYIDYTIIHLSKRLFGEDFVNTNKQKEFVFLCINDNDFKLTSVKNLNQIDKIETTKANRKILAIKHEKLRNLNYSNLVNGLNYLMEQATRLLLNQQLSTYELLIDKPSHEAVINLAKAIQKILENSISLLAIQDILEI